MKIIYAYHEKILVSLAVIAIVSLFAMNSRLGSVEAKDAAIEGRMALNEAKMESMASDIAAIRCYVSKDKLTCMKYENERTK